MQQLIPDDAYNRQILTKMMRNRMHNLIQMKQRYKGNRFTQTPTPLHAQPWWFQQYYQNKQALTLINNNNRNITALTRQYQVNPSVFSLKQVEKLITDNCQHIQAIDRWTNQFRYSSNDPALMQSQKLMIQYIQSTLAQEILNVFSNKQIINSVNNQIDQQSSFSRSRVMNQNTTFLNGSFNAGQSAFNMNNSFDGQDRNRMFQQVNSKIENLNLVLRRMNAMVVGQGDLVNRIDQNLVSTHANMVGANEQLRARADREQGISEQFSCYGKVNKVITALFVVNLVILLLFFLKHLIF